MTIRAAPTADGRGRRPERLRGAGRAEAEGGEEDLEAGGHSCNC